jgi:hypothetical protein
MATADIQKSPASNRFSGPRPAMAVAIASLVLLA